MEVEDLNLSLLLESTFAFWFSHPFHLTLTSGWLLRVPTQNVGWYLFIHFLFVFLLHSTPKQPIQINEESRNTDTRPSKKRQHILFLPLPQPASSKKTSPSTKSITASNIILKPEKYIVLIVVEEAMVVSELIVLLHCEKC